MSNELTPDSIPYRIRLCPRSDRREKELIVSGVFYHPHLANLFTLEILGVLILSLGWERDSEVTVLELVVFGLGLQLIFGGSVGE